MSFYSSFVKIPALVLRQRLRPLPLLDPFGTDTLPLRVWPGDIDFNLHLNNASHLSIMDYGRVHLLARGRVIDVIVRERWVPVVGAVWMTYRRSLPLWARYRLTTRLVAWDERWFYMEQIFKGDQGLVAVGWVKGALRGKSGAIKPQQLMDLVEPGIVSPPLSAAIETMNELTREKLREATELTSVELAR